VITVINLFMSTTFWLLATNLVLGLAVLLCFATLAWCVLSDVRRQRRRTRDESIVPDDYLDSLECLGIARPVASESIDKRVED
jgi:hypothetical protein